MSGKSQADPSFFKVLSTMDFTTTLRLPPAFSKKYESHLSGNVKLRSDGGRIWKVKMERMRNGGLFCLTRGWPKFAEDAALQLGEFLVFSLFNNSEFDVHIYKTNFCQRGLPPAVPTPTPTAELIVAAARSGSKAVLKPYFETRLKKHHKSRFNIPMEFAKAAGLDRRTHVKVELVRKEQRSKSKIVVVDYRHNSRVELAKGWPKFREANRLKIGKIYSFHFCPKQNAILVKELH